KRTARSLELLVQQREDAPGGAAIDVADRLAVGGLYRDLALLAAAFHLDAELLAGVAARLRGSELAPGEAGFRRHAPALDLGIDVSNVVQALRAIAILGRESAAVERHPDLPPG